MSDESDDKMECARSNDGQQMVDLVTPKNQNDIVTFNFGGEN